MVSWTLPARMVELSGSIDQRIVPGAAWAPTKDAVTADAQAAMTPAVTSLRQAKGTRPGAMRVLVLILLIPQCMDRVGASDLDRVAHDRRDRDPQRDEAAIRNGIGVSGMRSSNR